MKKTTGYIAITLLLAISLSVSCTKEDDFTKATDQEVSPALDKTNTVDVINGILVFKSRSDMQNYLDEVATNDALSHKESILGFKSLYSVCQTAFEQDEELWDSYENLNYSREEFLAAFESGELAEYSDATLELIKDGKLKYVTTEDGAEVVDYTTSAPYLAKVLNEDKLVCVNETIYQYNEHNIKLIPESNFDLIEKLESINENDKLTGVIVSKERKQKDTYYPTTIIDCASGADQSGTSYNSKKLKGYFRIKHFDYLTNDNKPWFYHAYYIQAYTYLYRWNFGWYWKPIGATVNAASCNWSQYLKWGGVWGYDNHSFISSEFGTSGSAGGTKLLYEGYSNAQDWGYSSFSGSVILQRTDDPAVMFTISHSYVAVPSRWF